MEFTVRTKKLKGTSIEIKGSARQLNAAGSKIDNVINRLDLGSSTGTIRNNLKNTRNKLVFLSAATSGIERNLRTIAFEYEKSEALIKNQRVIQKYKDAIRRAKDVIERAKETVDSVYKKGKNWYNKYVGDPVNLDNGNFIHEVSDLEIKGSEDFFFSRIYNSLSNEAGVFGKGWTHSFEIKLDLDINNAIVSREDGRHIIFDGNNGRYTISSGGTETLHEESGKYILCSDDDSYIFDEAGRFVRFENLNGSGYSLEYEEGLLVKVISDSGEFFVITYGKDGTGRIETVTDHTGRTVSYKYRNNNLVAVVCGEHVSEYGYDAADRVTGITNSEGVRLIRNEYDHEGRVTRQSFPDGSEMVYSYDDENHATVLTERNGAESYHYHDELSRNTENVYTNGTESYEYNDNNQITYEKDRNGNEAKYQYDDRGNVTRMVIANGTVINITYEKHNKPASISINGKRVQKNAYDERGNLVETVDAIGRRTSVKYNEKGLPVEIRTPGGNTTEVEYDERNNIVSVKDEQGVRYCYEYDKLNRVKTATDGKNNRSIFSYDIYGNLTGITDAAGNTRTYEYNKINKVVGMLDFNGAKTRIAYNELGFPCSMTDPMGRITELTYDNMWNVTSEKLPNGGIRRVEYDENNRPVKETDPLGNVKEYEYDGNGNLIAVYDAEGAITEYRYDSLDQLVFVKDPEGNETKYSYDGTGNLTYIRNANGGELRLEYDAANQLIRETDPLGQVREYTYTLDGDIASVTDEAGRILKIEYICKGRPSHVVYPDGKEESFTYDENGNVRTRSNKQGFTMTYSYDALNRLIEASGNNGEYFTYTYDEVGNLTSAADGDGNTSKYTYDLNGQLTSVTDELGNRTEYEYDSLDLLTAVNRIGENEVHRTEYVRDAAGNVIRTVDPLGFIEEFEYNTRGELIRKTDKDGYLTEFGYDLNGKLNSVRYNDGKEVILSHDALGKLAEVRDWTGVTKIESDVLGRVTKVIYPDERTAEYQYGRGGERTAIKHPDGRLVQYGYDNFLRLKTLKEGDTEISYEYDGFGQLISKSFAGGLVSNYSYDNKGQLIELVSSQSGKVLDSAKIGYDANGNRVSIERFREGIPEESGLFAFGYDAVGRLTDVHKDGVLGRQYSYDAFGNRKSLITPEGRIDYRYDAMDRLLATTGAVSEIFKYDKRGNITERSTDKGAICSYSYGAMNRLESTTGIAGTAKYEYNGLGHRIEDRIRYGLEPERRISYTLDMTKYYNNLLEITTNGETEAYIWDGNAVALKGANNYSFIYDDMGSPTRLLSADGNSADIYTYDEFGICTYELTDIQPLRYTGYRKDPIADMYFAQAREYMPEHGRFAAQDWVKGTTTFPDTLNSYAYCSSMPFRYIDPDGRFLVTALVATIAVGAGVGAVVGGGWELGTQLVGQLSTGDHQVHWDQINRGKIYTSMFSGAITGGFTAVGHPVVGSALGGFAEGSINSALEGHDFWTSVGAGVIDGAVSAAFAGAGEWFKTTKLSKNIKKSFLGGNNPINNFFKKYTTSYKGQIKRAFNAAEKGLFIHLTWKTWRNGIVSGLWKKATGSWRINPKNFLKKSIKGSLKCALYNG